MHPAVSKLSEMVTRFKTDPNMELEVVFVADASKTNVNFTDFENTFNVMHTSAKHGVFDLKKENAADFFYENGAVRARHVLGKPLAVVKKSRVASFKMTCPQRPGITIKVNLKLEKPIEYDTKAAVPIYVRIQEMWNFTYHEDFVFTFKKVGSGKDRQDACSRPVKFEMEIEKKHASIDSERNDADIAESLLAKAMDLLGRYDEKGESVALTLEIT